MAGVVAIALAPTLAHADPQYLIKVYPAKAEPAAQTTMKAFATDLGEQIGAIEPAYDGAGDPIPPIVIHEMTISPSAGGTPLGEKPQMEQALVQTGAIGVIQQRSFGIADLSSDFSFKEPPNVPSPLGLRADFVSLYGLFKPPSHGDSHAIAPVIQLHRVVIYYLAAREAFRQQRYTESLYYVQIAEGILGRTKPQQLAGVLADLDMLKARLIAKGGKPPR